MSVTGEQASPAASEPDEKLELDTALPPAQRAFGRYELLIEMGSGGMAILYLARVRGPQDFEKLLAIKKIHSHLARKAAFVRMFLDEARIAAKIHHPNVVTTFDLGQIEGSYFIAMEYVHGQNLTDLLKAAVRERDKLPWPLAVRLVADAAAGLHAAHELTTEDGRPLGVVHRDVSPQNILVSYDGHVKVTDFGIAFAAEKLEQTESGILKGKVAYMSPEQTRGDVVDRRSDIFALGIVLWEAVCLKRLFREPNEASALLRVREADVPPPRSQNSELPQALEDIVLKALALDPADRYDTAEELSEALERLLVSENQVVARKNVAKAVSGLFHDRRRLKEEQIQTAKENAASSPVKGVGMAAGSTGSLELPTDARGEMSHLRRRRSPWIWIATLAVVIAGLVTALVLWKPGRSGSEASAEHAAAPSPPPPHKTRRARPVPVDAAARRTSAPRQVTLRIRITPSDAPAEVMYRGQVVRGARFERVVSRSHKAERITVRAKGFLPQTLVVVPSEDTDIPVQLKRAPPRPRRRVRPRRYHRPRPRGGLRDLPD